MRRAPADSAAGHHGDHLAMIPALSHRAVERAIQRDGVKLLHGALQRSLPRGIKSPRI